MTVYVGVEMNGIQSTKAQNINVDKHVVGCLGRMVNLFDLSAGIPGNRLLTDKPHRDGDFLFHEYIFFCNFLIKISITMSNAFLALDINICFLILRNFSGFL